MTEENSGERGPTGAGTARLALVRQAISGGVDSVLGWQPVRRGLTVLGVYNDAGGGLLAAGLAFGALFAGLTGLLFGFGILGFLVPAEADRQRLVAGLGGQVAFLAPIAKDGLASVAAHAGAFSIVGLVGMGWGASQFYGSIDEAMARVFARAPARSPVARLIRGAVSVLLLVGGLLSGIALSAIQAVLASRLPPGGEGDAGRAFSAVAFPLVTVIIVVVAVGTVYRIVPNMNVPLSDLRVPAIVTGVVLAGLTEAFVYLAPRLIGALSVFGGFAAVFAALTWLSFAFQVLLLGAAWTRIRLGDPPD